LGKNQSIARKFLPNDGRQRLLLLWVIGRELVRLPHLSILQNVPAEVAAYAKRSKIGARIGAV